MSTGSWVRWLANRLAVPRRRLRSAVEAWLVMWIVYGFSPNPLTEAELDEERGADSQAEGPSAAQVPRSPGRFHWMKERGGKAIPVFERDTATGLQIVSKRRYLARQSNLLLLESAVFDPVLEGEPDYSAFLPGQSRTRSATHGSYYLVQFKDRILPHERAELESTGAVVVQYVPNNAYIVRMTTEVRSRVSGSSFVRWHGPFLPGYKVQSRLMREATGLDRPSSPDSLVGLIAILFPEEDVHAVAAEIESFGLRVVEAIPDVDDATIEIEAPRGGLLASLQDLSAVEAISWLQFKPRFELSNDHSVWVGQAYDTVNGPTEAGSLEYPVSGAIWKRDILGTGQVVAVADTGLDRDACQFRDPSACPVATQSVRAPGALTISPDQRKVIAYNVLPGAVAGDSDICVFHGTHTSGTVAGDNLANASTSTTAAHDTGDGMAPQAKIVFEDIGKDIVGGLIDFCVLVGVPIRLQDLWAQERNAGASIASNSWGPFCSSPPCGEYTGNSMMTDRFVWENSDFVIFFAAGNAGLASADGSVSYAEKNALVIGGTFSGGSADRANSLRSSSSRGPTADGRHKPDITAPGVALSAAGSLDPPDCRAPTCGLAWLGGTSMACPTAAGLAALVRQYYMEGWYPTGSKTPAHAMTPSAALVKATMINGAMNMTGADVGGDAPNYDQGWGRVHLDNALYFDDALETDDRKTRVWDVPLTDGLMAGEMDEYQFRVNPGQPLEVTLVWTDPAGAPFSGQALVNNLDLEVVGPGGTYKGNVWVDPTPAAPDNDKQSAVDPPEKDDLNNVEGVLILAPVSGSYTIRVKGFNIPGAGSLPGVPGDPTLMRQSYALVVTGGVELTAGSVSFSHRSYPCGSSSLTVNLFDDTASPSTVTLSSSATGDSEEVVMTGASPHYSAMIPLEFNVAAAAGDGKLQVGDSSRVTATYTDAFTSSATTTIGSCAPLLALKGSAFSGGCDSDRYLDANETADLTVTLRNLTVNPLPDLTGALTTTTPGVVIGTDTINFGTVAPGSLISSPVPFRVSALGVAAGTLAEFKLSLTAEGFSRAAEISFTSPLEQDVVLATAHFNFDFGAGSEISPPCAPDPNTRWTILQVSGSAQGLAIVSTCDATAPSPPRILAMSLTTPTPYQCGTIPSECSDYADEHITEVQSPWVFTTPPGSVFVSATPKQLRYKVRMGFPKNPSVGDDFFAELLDKSLNSAFVAGSFAANNSPLNTDRWESVTVDLTREDLEDLVDTSQLGIVFVLDTTDATESSLTGTLRLDDVELIYDSEGRFADASTCSLPCSAPGTPLDLTATNPPGTVHLEWSPVGGAGEYHLYRGTAGCAGALTKIAEIPGTWISYSDTAAVAGTSYAYALRSADATGACESSESNCVAITPASGTCGAAPTFGGVTSVTSNDSNMCGILVAFAPGASNCGGGVTYNVYRSTSSAFAPGPGNLVASGVPGSPYVDGEVGSLTRYCYAVRAVDPNSNIDGNTQVLCATTSGPRIAGTFMDNAEGPGLLAMAIPWTRSINENHNAGGSVSYRSSTASLYPNLTCGAATSPELELGPTGASTLSFWTRYNVEHQWDGMVVEVATASGGFDDWTPISGPGFYPSDLSQTGACAVGRFCPAQRYCNVCCYAPTQGAFNGPSGNLDLTPWSSAAVDLSGYNGQTIKFRFNFSTDPLVQYQGIYVDEIALTNVVQPTACVAGSCTHGPVFYGLVSAVDLDPGADTGVRLTWNPPTDWGSGAAGDMLVYRNGTLIATLPGAAVSYDDTVGQDGTTYTYQVVAVNGCGMRDGNSITRSIGDCAVSDAAVDASNLQVTVVGGKLRLSWTAVPGASVSRVHWIAGSALTASCGPGSVWSGEVVDAAAPTLAFDHDVYSDGLTYFYSIAGTSGGVCPERRGASCP